MTTVWIQQSSSQGFTTNSYFEFRILELAFKHGEEIVQLQGQTYFLNMTPNPRYQHCDIRQNPDTTLTRFSCPFFYQCDATRWAPCHYIVCHALVALSKQREAVAPSSFTDGERDYSLTDMTQMNKDSGRKRALLCVSENEISTVRELGVWYHYSSDCDVNTPPHMLGRPLKPLSYEYCERLEAAYRDKLNVVATNTLYCSVNIFKSDIGVTVVCGSITDPSLPVPLVCRRYPVEFMALNDDTQIESLDPAVSERLNEFLRGMDTIGVNKTCVVDRHQYDFANWSRIDTATNSVRPFFRLVQTSLPNKVHNKVHPLSSSCNLKYLTIATKPCNPDIVALLMEDTEGSGTMTILKYLYLCSILLHEFYGVQDLYGQAVRELFLESKMPTAPITCHACKDVPINTLVAKFRSEVEPKLTSEYFMKLSCIAEDSCSCTIQFSGGLETKVIIVACDISETLLECDNVKIEQGIREIIEM